MATKTLKGKFLPQYRTAAQWSAADTVLLRGEIGVESDTRKFKFGDGTTSWNNLGYAQGESAGGSSEIIYISDAESISKAVISVEWNELGQIRPIIIFDPASVAGLPADVPSNCTLIGNVQKVDDGTISSDDGYVVNLNVFQEDNFLSGIWYQILLNSAGEVLEEKKYSLDNKGLLRDAKYLGTSFWALISSNDTDIQAFVVDENSPEVPAEYKGEGFGFARHYRDDVGMATVTIKLNSGRVKTFNVTFYGDGSDAYWEETGGSSGSSLPFDGPIPGYELVYSYTGAVLQLASGTWVTINFDKAIPAAQMFTSKARFMIEADIVSVSGNTLSNVARVPIAIFKPTAAGQPVFEYMIQSIATGTNIGRVRLIITSWIRESGSTGDITGCNLMAQVNNLNPSMNYALTFPGMYVKSSGGGQ